jgi:hypothetical protein
MGDYLKQLEGEHTMTEEFEDYWGEFGLHMGPLGFGFFGPRRSVRYSRTADSHMLRLQINPDISKEEIKVRLVKPGVLQIEWPRKLKGEEIPVQ